MKTGVISDESERVILVDRHDRAIGSGGKLPVHRSGELHRAFSIFAVDRSGRTLLQQRALCKYHSPLLWANTCCGHPRPGESRIDAAQRRLGEELGLAAKLIPAGRTLYRADLGKGLVEHELVQIYCCRVDAKPQPDPREVAAFRFVEPAELKADAVRNPQEYAAWLHHYLETLWPQLRAAMWELSLPRFQLTGTRGHS